MNNFQWIILFLIAFFAIGMIWFAKTYIPEISIAAKTPILQSPAIGQTQPNKDGLQLPSKGGGPTVVIYGSKKAVVVPVAKYSYTPARDIDLSNISAYRIQNGRKVLSFKDGSQTYLTDEDYRQLSPGIRLRFEYRQGKP